MAALRFFVNRTILGYIDVDIPEDKETLVSTDPSRLTRKERRERAKERQDLYRKAVEKKERGEVAWYGPKYNPQHFDYDYTLVMGECYARIAPDDHITENDSGKETCGKFAEEKDIITYQRTDRTGNTFRAIEFTGDNGNISIIVRNQRHDPDRWFMLGIYPSEEARKKIDFWCGKE